MNDAYNFVNLEESFLNLDEKNHKRSTRIMCWLGVLVMSLPAAAFEFIRKYLISSFFANHLAYISFLNCVTKCTCIYSIFQKVPQISIIYSNVIYFASVGLLSFMV